jgi:2-hydroxy-3-keto-5-methylthiopentenyl-1-phosphate phosphatase
MKCHVLVDFDGTIATVDTTDLLLGRFADPAWTEIEEAWKAGLMGSRECMLRQIDLVRATPAELDDLIGAITIDPAFPSFVELCRSEGMHVAVVSDGLDRTVGAVLARYGLDLPFYANRLAHVGGDRWRLAFPHARGDCRSLAGTCKCGHLMTPAGTVRIVVGDGRSDFCVAGEADLVLAKGALAHHCEVAGLAYFPIQSFADATPLLRGWLDEASVQARDGADEIRDE